MRIGCFHAAAICAASLVAQTQDGGWPQEIDTGSIHLVIYQPQVESWQDNRITARSAVILTRKPPTGEVFGTVTLTARTDVDREARMVTFQDPDVSAVSFPTAANLEPTLRTAVRDSLRSWPRTVSLDRLLADLAINEAGSKSGAMQLKNDPPRILLSKSPAVLILIDGEPVYRPVPGSRFTRVANTPALMLFDPQARVFYLDGGQWWMTAGSLTGPWSVAPNPPGELNGIRQDLIKEEERDPSAPAPAAANGPPPVVFVSTSPAELLVTRGEPQFSPIPQTRLLYVSNSDDDIFMDTAGQQYYTVLAGRWFRSKMLEGNWEYVPGDQVPSDFYQITANSPQAHVLASLPGTEQAREAVVANEIPQTATVNRRDARLTVRYSGPPEFRPIEGTALSYAVNTPSEVIRAGGRYYAVENGVWFVGDQPTGPWQVADMVPAEIYSIPPSCPLYHVRYVRVYGSTPDYVYVGYTPGYLGAFVYGGVVVFGTGWHYPWVFCGDYWCGWPWTWGFSFRFSYWAGGWFWRPAGHYWWYHSTPPLRRVFTEHWNPHWNAGGPNWIRGNVNAYSRWRTGAVAPRITPRPGGPTAARPNAPGRPDLYAGRDGQVYQRRSDGWYRQDGSGKWNRTEPNPQLDRQRDSRSLGQSRQREFENRGHAPGVPRSASPGRAGGGRPGPARAPGKR